jgi:hypothetical protein
VERAGVEWFDPGKADVGRPGMRARGDELEITLVKTAVAVAKVEVDYSTDRTQTRRHGKETTGNEGEGGVVLSAERLWRVVGQVLIDVVTLCLLLSCLIWHCSSHPVTWINDGTRDSGLRPGLRKRLHVTLSLQYFHG